MVRKNVFVVLGKDERSKKEKVERIKSLINQREPSLNIFHFLAEEISLEEFQKELKNFSFQRRLFIFRNSERLSPQVKNYLLKVIDDREVEDFFIFDFGVDLEEREKLQQNDTFFSLLFKISPPFKTGEPFLKTFSFKDLSQALRKRLTGRALIILSSLLKRGKKEELSLQVLGMMVRIFVDFAPASCREKNLKHIFEAERLIKEEGVLPSLVLELLIIKLTLQKF